MVSKLSQVNISLQSKIIINLPEVFFKQVLASLSVCLIVASSGILFGFATISLPYLDLDTTEQSWFASLDFFCASIFAPVGGMVSGWIGRKKTMILFSPITALGWLFISFSESKTTLFVGRFISCMANALLISPPSMSVVLSCKDYDH